MSLLSGLLHDQAALHGLLDRIRELNLTLMSVTSVVPARGGGVRDWQRWVPYAAVAWSLVYAALGVYWVVSGRGFPYAPETVSDVIGPVIGRFGPGVAWIFVMMAWIPAAAVGTAMLHGVRSRVLRPLFITAGALLAGILLLLMTDINLLLLLGYTPLGIVKLLTGAEFGQVYLEMLTQWTVVHQLLCLISGFLWLAATVSYARRSGDACCIAAAEMARKGGIAQTMPRAGAGSPCMCRW